MDTALVYSRLHLIGILRLLWLINKRNFSLPSPSVPRNSSRQCSLVRSAPAEHRGLMEAFISVLCVFDISLAAEVWLDNKNVMICVLKIVT